MESHKPVKGKLHVTVKLDQFGDEALGHGISLDYAERFLVKKRTSLKSK
jgi:hypothetical protein